jgi:succinoglycan biosynthesis protein ExoM
MTDVPTTHVCVCVCTFKRSALLKKLLEALPRQIQGRIPFVISVVVVDNDAAGTAESTVAAMRGCGFDLTYAIVSERNFASVRNRAVALAHGDFIAFVDDDEVPRPEWLSALLDQQKKSGASGVLGPVRPYFDNEPPQWLVKSRICDRPVHPTGMELHWRQTRTGNVLLQAKLFKESRLQFDLHYATGGEDVDFFKRAIAAGHKFVWCEEAPVYELVPPERCRKSYYLKRGLLQGGISLNYATDGLSTANKLKILGKSVPALCLYTLSLPFVLAIGFHLAIRVLIKWCHHFGRLSALLGIKLIRERNF